MKEKFQIKRIKLKGKIQIYISSVYVSVDGDDLTKVKKRIYLT